VTTSGGEKANFLAESRAAGGERIQKKTSTVNRKFWEVGGAGLRELQKLCAAKMGKKKVGNRRREMLQTCLTFPGLEQNEQRKIVTQEKGESHAVCIKGESRSGCEDRLCRKRRNKRRGNLEKKKRRAGKKATVMFTLLQGERDTVQMENPSGKSNGYC